MIHRYCWVVPALPGDVDGRDLAAVAVALREEELAARRVPADQVAVTAAGDQQAVLHHEPVIVVSKSGLDDLMIRVIG